MYAIVNDGVVADLVSLPADETDLAALPFLSAAQVAATVEIPDGLAVSVGWSYSAGVFAPPPVTAPPASPLSPQQMAQAALDRGLALTSTSTPTLNATYSLSLVDQMGITAIYLSLKSDDGFPGGTEPYPYHDASGISHSFTSAQFLAFALVVRDYVASVRHAMFEGVTMPSNAYTIE